MTDQLRSFVCIDCGWIIHSFPPLDGPRCTGCQWLADLPADIPVEEKAALRERMICNSVIRRPP
jgi:hypothetical protein